MKKLKSLFKILLIVLAILFIVYQAFYYSSVRSLYKIVDNFPKEFEHYTYDKGSYSDKVLIDNSDVRYQKLHKWFLENKSGWEIDINTYAPGEVFFSNELRINILGDGVIVDFYDGGNSTMQMSIGSGPEF